MGIWSNELKKNSTKKQSPITRSLALSVFDKFIKVITILYVYSFFFSSSVAKSQPTIVLTGYYIP